MAHITAAWAVVPLCATAIKIAVEAVGIWYGIKYRRALFVAAMLITGATTIARGLVDAGASVPGMVADGVVYWSTPGVASIVASFIAGRFDAIEIGRGWRL